MGRRTWLATTGVLALAMGASPAAAADPRPKSAAARIGESLPLGGVVTVPEWVRKPSGDELANLYPKLAQIMDLDGRAVMDCGVKASGELGDCRIASEAPLGVGFGYATLQAASTFRMKPMTLDGQPVAGARVQVPMRWQAWRADSTVQTSPDVPDTVAVSESRLALARHIMQATAFAALFKKGVDKAVADVETAQNEAGAVTHPAERGLALQSIREAGQEGAALWVEKIARKVAAKMTDAELTQTAAFMDSPAGKAWVGLGDMVSKQENDQIAYKVYKDAGVRFCRKTQCAAVVPAAARASGQP